MRSFVKIKHSRNGEITLSLTGVGKSCKRHDFLTWQICLFTLLIRENEILAKISELQHLCHLFVSVYFKKTFCSGFIIETRKLLIFVRLYLSVFTVDDGHP